MKPLFQITIFLCFFLFVACKKKDKNEEAKGLYEIPYENSNGWEVVAVMQQKDQNNLNFFNLEYARIHGDVLDAVVTRNNPLTNIDVSARWQHNIKSQTEVRYLDEVPWKSVSQDYANNNAILTNPYKAESKGLGDDDLLVCRPGGIFSFGNGIELPNRYNYGANYIIDLKGEKSFMLSRYVQSNYKVDCYARIFNSDGYDIYFGANVTHVAAGINSNGRLVTASFNTAQSIYNEPAFSIYESTMYLGNYPLIGGSTVMHPSVVKKSYKLEDFEGGIPSGSVMSFQQIKGNKVQFVLSNSVQTCMMELDLDNYTITKIADLPYTDTNFSYFIDGKDYQFVDLASFKYWNGISMIPITYPSYKGETFNESTYYNDGAIWNLISYKVDGIKYLYILKKNL